MLWHLEKKLLRVSRLFILVYNTLIFRVRKWRMVWGRRLELNRMNHMSDDTTQWYEELETSVEARISHSIITNSQEWMKCCHASHKLKMKTTNFFLPLAAFPPQIRKPKAKRIQLRQNFLEIDELLLPFAHNANRIKMKKKKVQSSSKALEIPLNFLFSSVLPWLHWGTCKNLFFLLRVALFLSTQIESELSAAWL